MPKYPKKGKRRQGDRLNPYPAPKRTKQTAPRTGGWLQPSKAEFKFVDVASTTTAANSTGSVVLLNGIARGDSVSERTGRQVTMRSVYLQYELYATVGTGLNQIHRVMLVLDKQVNATTPSVADIVSSGDVRGFRNLDNRNRFAILIDRHYEIAQSTTTGTHQFDKIYRRLNTITTYNNGDAGTVADIKTNALFLVILGSEGAGTTAGSVLHNSRVRYNDG